MEKARFGFLAPGRSIDSECAINAWTGSSLSDSMQNRLKTKHRKKRRKTNRRKIKRRETKQRKTKRRKTKRRKTKRRK